MALAMPLFLVSCQEDEIQKNEELKQVSLPENSSAPGKLMKAGDQSFSVSSTAITVQNRIKLYKAEYITSGKNAEAGNTVFFNDRGNKQLDADFVPSLSLDGSKNISFYVDLLRPSKSLSVGVTENAIVRAMHTWDNVNCSNLGITKIPATNRPTGFISSILGYGGSTDYVADINHAGWMSSSFFDQVAPNGGNFILGVTFTLIFTDKNGNPSDADGNNKLDVAWRETYYNDNFNWNNGAEYDVESIALHESGHGLSQGHFGKAFLSGNGKLHFAPRAVMNASYSGIQNTVGKSDLGGHCSIWGSSPK